jgi:hypothetical protein
MNAWNYVRAFSTWVWGCARAWIEIGHRVQALEGRLQNLSDAYVRDDEHLRAALTTAVESAKADRNRIHARIDELDRAQQNRIDDWAQQLSGQINQVYITVATSKVRNR